VVGYHAPTLAGFYIRHGLEASPADPLHLMILIKDIATALDAATHAP
jgi:hypothetical protein